MTRRTLIAIAATCALVHTTAALGQQPKATFDPTEARIVKFVAHLDKFGIKLEPDPKSKSGRWKIIEPKFAGGSLQVSIAAFSIRATEAQMREALREAPWSWPYLSADAQLSMSRIGASFEKARPDEVTALEERLRHLFFWYQRVEKFPLKNGLTNEVMEAGLNPKDQRILTLVEYLRRNGIQIAFSKEFGWRIVEPKHTDGWLSVSIRTFPATATEQQMRFALADINLFYELNVNGHIAMSRISTHDSKGSPLPKGLEAKLQRLFHEYAPSDKSGMQVSHDGILSVTLSVTPTKVAPDDPIEVMITMRNLSDQAIVAVRPCPWPGYPNFRIRGSQGFLGFFGEPPPRMEEKWWRLGGALVKLGPGAAFKDTVKLEWRNFPDLRKPATYEFVYNGTYAPSFDWIEKRENVALWKGQFPEARVPVEVQGRNPHKK